MDLKTFLTFDDVLLLPQYSNIKSRSEVSLSSKLSEGINLRVPIIASPMDTVCGTYMCNKMMNK